MCCQFEKVNRTKNRWKISMRDGVFHINGEQLLCVCARACVCRCVCVHAHVCGTVFVYKGV